MNLRKPQLAAFLGALCCLFLVSTQAQAADTEIYEGGICTTTTTETVTTTTETTVPANVVFIIDTSGSMGWAVGGQNETVDADNPSRLSIVKGVFENLINDTTGINAALMRFDDQGNSGNNSGGYFIKSMQEITADSRPGFITAVNDLTAGSRTPLAETLYEAALYFLGSSPHFGNSSPPGTNVAGVLNGNNYNSPITAASKNYVVYLTDGEPNQDGAADSLLNNTNLPGWNGDTCGFIVGDSGNEAANSDDCLDEIAYYLNHHDFHDADGQQNVTTYTIGFTTNQALLQTTADNGGGSYFTTSSASGLADTLNQILTEITTQQVTTTTTSTDQIEHTRGSFIPPAIGVDAFNRTSHRNALYFALFQNNNKAIWDGNVKSYKLGGDPLHIVDADGNDVLDTSGQFVATSRSLWSNTDDGDAIISGGANGQLPAAAARTLYTKADNTAGALTALGGADPTLFGCAANDTTCRDDFVNIAKGSILADPLHSQPVVVNYGGTESSPEISLFVGTNAGFLHAINAVTGVEQSAYIPNELLQPYLTQLGQSGSHHDGLDGSPVVWKTDNNNNGLVDGSDHVYLYIGMRRGGNNYYALDVTSPSAPELKWVIEGGSGSFTELGQSWSKPVLTTLLHNGTATKVLIFAGGYSSTDTTGRAIYIVNAATGARLWWAGPSTTCSDTQACLTHSIPSDVRAIDSDKDGYTDRLYVGDMGGHVFRVDLTDSSGITGSVTTLASLGGASPNDRRFFYPPDVVLTRPTPGAPMYFSVNIGSGDREHPKTNTTTQDRFYSIKDYHVHDSDFTGVNSITENDMLNVTSNDIGAATGTTQQDAIYALNSAANRGWYIRLTTPGEKVLAESLTINGTLYFTTYVPPTTGLTDCPPPIGNGRLYKVSLFDATPVAADRYLELDQDGIPPAPTLVFVPAPPVDPTCTSNCLSPDDPTPTVCTGPQCDPNPAEVMMYRSYWRQQ